MPLMAHQELMAQTVQRVQQELMAQTAQTAQQAQMEVLEQPQEQLLELEGQVDLRVLEVD
jgi:hypothetical protein